MTQSMTVVEAVDRVHAAPYQSHRAVANRHACQQTRGPTLQALVFGEENDDGYIATYSYHCHYAHQHS